MLNLLPNFEKRLLAQERRKRLFIVLFSEFLVFLVCMVLVLLAIVFYGLTEVTSQNFLLEQAKNESQSSEFLYFENVMQDYNQKLVLVDSFYKNKKSLLGALNALLSAERPAGLYFSKFSLQADNQTGNIKVVITGASNTRENLIIFKNNIEAESKIKNIVFSPDSWIRQKDIIFNLTLNIPNEQ